MASSEDNNFLTDTFTSAKELITERFSSPFIFSFLVSWIIFNYKSVIIAFTDVSESFSIDEKLCLINESLLKTSFNFPFTDIPILLNAFVLPFMAACFYTFIYPFADYYITKFTLERKVQIRNARIVAEGKITYSQKDVQKIYQQNSMVEKDLTTRLERAEITENQLRAVIKNLEEKSEDEKKDVSTKTSIEEIGQVSQVDTKLDLIDAYIKMDDIEGATELLNEVIKEGNVNQRKRAMTRMKKISNLAKTPNKSEKTDDSFDDIELQVIEAIGTMHNENISQANETDLKKRVKVSIVDFNLAMKNLLNKNAVHVMHSASRGTSYRLEELGLKIYKKTHPTK